MSQANNFALTSTANNFALTSTVNYFTTSRNNPKSASISHDSARVTTPNEKEGIHEICAAETAETNSEITKKNKSKSLRFLLRSCRKRNVMLQKQNDTTVQLLLKLRSDKILTDSYLEDLRESLPEAVSILNKIV